MKSSPDGTGTRGGLDPPANPPSNQDELGASSRSFSATAQTLDPEGCTAYTADVDWRAPEQASELAEYRKFAVANADSIRASAVVRPTSTATVVRVEGARGGNVVTTDHPYARRRDDE